MCFILYLQSRNDIDNKISDTVSYKSVIIFEKHYFTILVFEGMIDFTQAYVNNFSRKKVEERKC